MNEHPTKVTSNHINAMIDRAQDDFDVDVQNYSLDELHIFLNFLTIPNPDYESDPDVQRTNALKQFNKIIEQSDELLPDVIFVELHDFILNKLMVRDNLPVKMVKEILHFIIQVGDCFNGDRVVDVYNWIKQYLPDTDALLAISSLAKEFLIISQLILGVSDDECNDMNAMIELYNMENTHDGAIAIIGAISSHPELASEMVPLMDLLISDFQEKPNQEKELVYMILRKYIKSDLGSQWILDLPNPSELFMQCSQDRQMFKYALKVLLTLSHNLQNPSTFFIKLNENRDNNILQRAILYEGAVKRIAFEICLLIASKTPEDIDYLNDLGILKFIYESIDENLHFKDKVLYTKILCTAITKGSEDFISTFATENFIAYIVDQFSSFKMEDQFLVLSSLYTIAAVLKNKGADIVDYLMSSSEFNETLNEIIDDDDKKSDKLALLAGSFMDLMCP